MHIDPLLASTTGSRPVVERGRATPRPRPHAGWLSISHRRDMTITVVGLAPLVASILVGFATRSWGR